MVVREVLLRYCEAEDGQLFMSRNRTEYMLWEVRANAMLCVLQVLPVYVMAVH